MKSFIRTIGYILLILTSIYFINDTSFSHAADSWVLSEVQISGGNGWSTFWTHDDPNVNGTSTAESLIDVENGKYKVRLSIEMYDEINNVAMESEYEKPPDILISGETIELDFTWSQVAGHEAYSHLCSDFRFGYYDKSDHHYEYADSDHPQNKLVFTVPQVIPNEEYVIYLTNEGPQTKFNGIKWIYRPAKIPIIFIPGVGGSVLKRGSLELWPKRTDIFGGREQLALNTDGTSNVAIVASDIIRSVFSSDIYGSFITAVESWGYNENQDFFVFPYDWRLDNFAHVEALDNKINEALASTGEKKAIIIAHSMGGIVARAYMKEKGTNKIDRFITMGTPHKGSVKPYYAFLSGYNFGNKLAGNSLMKVVMQNCPSAYQLLPWEQFISGPKREWSLDESFEVKYHSTWLPPGSLMYFDSHDWEWGLNPNMLATASAFRTRIGENAPSGIETYTIIGQGVATLSSYTAREPVWYEPYTGIKKEDGSRWVLEPNPVNDFDDGDGTVPLWSAAGLKGDKKFYIEDLPGNSAEHGSLPANKLVQDLIKDIIRGEQVDVNIYPKIEKFGLSGDKTGFEIHSSANLHIYDSSGNHLGVNEYGSIDESIPGGTMIAMDGYEYCSILDPEGSYMVEVVGFEEGNFSLSFFRNMEGKELEFEYPEINVVDGTQALLDIPNINFDTTNLPSIVVTSENVNTSYYPDILESVNIPVFDRYLPLVYTAVKGVIVLFVGLVLLGYLSEKQII